MNDDLFYAKSVCMNDGSLIEYRSTFPETITGTYPDGTRVIQTADKCVTILSKKRLKELLKQQQGYRSRVIELLGQGSVRNRSEIDRLSEKIDELDIVLRSGIIEERSNDGSHYTKDEHGRFTGSTPYAGSSSRGGGGAKDSGTKNIRITDEAIEKVPEADIFDDEEKNKRYRQANMELLKEAQKHPVGTEVSIIYDENMNPIKEHGYVVGKKLGQVRIDDHDKPYHAFHNHPSGESLGSEDLLQFALKDNQLSITAEGNNANNYCMIKNPYSDASGYATFLIKKMDAKTFGGGRYSYKEIKEFDITVLSDDLKNDIVQQLRIYNHECIKGGEKYGFTYIESKTD